jgi:hypothetical protein
MLIVPGFEKVCSTCAHWRGSASMDEEGFVSAPLDLDGPCAALTCWFKPESNRALTRPAHTCALWAQRSVAEAVANEPPPQKVSRRR